MQAAVDAAVQRLRAGGTAALKGVDVPRLSASLASACTAQQQQSPDAAGDVIALQVCCACHSQP
jgi:hypothetical protein